MTQGFASPRFVLTGPSGWIGQAMLDALTKWCGGRLGSRLTAFGSHARSIELSSGERIEIRALATMTPDDVAGAHVCHFAYLTKEKAEEFGETRFAAANSAIDDALFTAIDHAKPASLFVASSGAAALAERGADTHPYGLAKLRQEARFLGWAASAGVPTIVGRIFNIAGPHINKLRSYAISDMALQAIESAQIRIQAGVPVFRSYLHVEDLCAMIIAAAQRGVGRMAPVDLCGMEVIEMADLAARVAEFSHNSPLIQRGSVDFTRPSVYLGDATMTKVLAMELGLDLAPLSAQIADTIAWLRQRGAKPVVSKERVKCG